jgi:hypothetical protein
LICIVFLLTAVSAMAQTAQRVRLGSGDDHHDFPGRKFH